MHGPHWWHRCLAGAVARALGLAAGLRNICHRDNGRWADAVLGLTGVDEQGSPSDRPKLRRVLDFYCLLICKSRYESICRCLIIAISSFGIP